MKKTLVHWFGLFGVIGFASYVIGSLFAPSAYPGYNWMSQSVSDLYRVDAPSFALWNQIAILYAIGGLVCVLMLSIAVQGKWNKSLRFGIYLLAGATWTSSISATILRFSTAENAIVVPSLISIIINQAVIWLIAISMILMMVGGYRKKRFVSIAVSATAALVLLLIGMTCLIFVPVEYSGIINRIITLSVIGFTALLGLFLFMGKLDDTGNNHTG